MKVLLLPSSFLVLFVATRWAAAAAPRPPSDASTASNQRRRVASRGEPMASGGRAFTAAVSSSLTAASSSIIRSTRAVRPLSLPVVVNIAESSSSSQLRRRLGADKTVGGGGTPTEDDDNDTDDALLPSTNPPTAAPTGVPTAGGDNTGGGNGGGGIAAPPPPPPTLAPVVSPSNGGGGEGGGSTAPPPTLAPVSSSGGGGGTTSTPQMAIVGLLDFVVQYDSSQQTEAQVLTSLNSTLTDGFAQQYPTTKKVRLVVVTDDGTTQSARSSAGGDTNNRLRRSRSLQGGGGGNASTSLPVSGTVTFRVTSDQPVPSEDDVHTLQTSLLQEWQQSTASGTTVTYPAVQGPPTNSGGGGGGGGSSSSTSKSSSSNAGTIVGVVVALLVVGIVAAALVVRRYRQRGTPLSSSRDRDHLQVEILSEINDDSHDGDDLNGIREKRSMEHAECDIEIEQLDASSKNGGVVMVTTSPTSVAYAQFNPDERNNGGNSPDSVFLASSASPTDAMSVASRGAFSTSTTVAASLTDTETKKEQNRALTSLLTFFARQSKNKDDAASVASSLTNPRHIQWVEPEEKKDEEDVEVSLPTPPALVTPPSPPTLPLPSSPPASPMGAISPAASLDSMENYSLASASYGPQQQRPLSLRHPAASKWIAPARARAPSVESYHSDTESMFTSGDYYGGSSVVSEAAVLAPTQVPGTTTTFLYSTRIEDNTVATSSPLLGRSASGETTEGEDSSADEIMGRASRRTPTRSPPVVTQKSSPTSVMSPMDTTPPRGKSRRGGSSNDVVDEDEPFDETLEDEHDLELFAAELERAKANPKSLSSSSTRTVDGTRLLKAAVSSDSSNSHGNSSGAHEETLSGYLRHKVGEARDARTDAAAVPPQRPRRGMLNAKAAAL